MRNVLIVDNDPGAMFWLAEVLVSANFQPWPACTIPDAISLAGSKCMSPLDLAIVNPSLRGAADLISHLRRHRANLRVLALGHKTTSLRGVDSWLEIPNSADGSAKQKWTRAINRVCSGYRRAA